MDLLPSGRSSVRVGGLGFGFGLGLGLAEFAGETDNLEGGRVVEDGVTGLPADLVYGGGGAGDFRERKGEMEEVDLWDLVELVPDIALEKER